MPKSLTRIIGEGIFWLSASTAAIKAVSLITIAVILSRLSVYEYGLVKLVLSVIPLLGFFLLPGLSNVVIADMGIEKGKGEMGKMKGIFFSYLRLLSFGALAAWAFVFFGADVIAQFYKGQVSSLLKIVSFLFLLEPARTAFLVAFGVYLKFLYQSLYVFLEAFLRLLLVAVLFFVFQMSASGVVLSTVLAELLAVVCLAPLFLSVYRNFSSVQVQGRFSIFGILRFHGKWSLFSTYVNTLGPNIRLWILKFLVSTEAVGLYAVAAGLFSHTMALLSLSGVLMPVLPQYVHEKGRFHRLIHKAIKYQLLGYICLGVAAAVLFPPVMVLLFPNYAPAMPLFVVMLLAMIPLSFAAVFTPTFFALQAQKSLFFAIMFKTIMILILAPFLIGTFGLMGVVYEFIATSTLFVLERYRRLKQFLPGFRLSLKQFLTVDADDYIILGKVFRFLARLTQR